jgi:hypothetical protein
MRVIARIIADIRNLLVNVSFYATAPRRVKLGEVADFQARTVAAALWATQCTDTEETSLALRAAKRLHKKRSNIGFQFAQVFFRVYRRCAARSRRGHRLFVNAIGHVARYEYTRMPALDQVLRDQITV